MEASFLTVREWSIKNVKEENKDDSCEELKLEVLKLRGFNKYK